MSEFGMSLEPQPLQQAGLNHRFVVASRAIQTVMEQVRRAATFPKYTVFISGETGVGKEEIAKQIHLWTRKIVPHRVGRFIKVNLSTMNSHVIESELFGHVRGAYTGAETSRTGLIEAAQKGTLFFDEIGDLDGTNQKKLLNFFDDGCIRPVGSNATIPIDTRIVSATNVDLQEAMRWKSFREDLYHRLARVVIRVPPLRERLEEIPALVQAFIERINVENQTSIPLDVSPELVHFLVNQDWPGNARDLYNAISTAAMYCDGGEIRPEHIPVRPKGGTDQEENQQDQLTAPLPVREREPRTNNLVEAGKKAAREAERPLILAELVAQRWNRRKAAGRLGVSYKTLLNKMEELGISDPLTSRRGAGSDISKDDE
jgi:DNA-binding NtrC family response regulator